MSFTITSNTKSAHLREMIERARWKRPVIKECEPFIIAIDVNGILPCHLTSTQDASKILVLFGEILNLSSLRSLLSIYDSSALTADSAGLALLAIETFGNPSLALLEGAFSGAIVEPSARRVTLFSDSKGQMSAYHTIGQGLWLAPEIKLFCLREDFKPVFAPVEQVAEFDRRSDGFCPIMNVRRVKPGKSVTIVWDGNNEPVTTSVLYHSFRPSEDRLLTHTETEMLIGKLLEDSIRGCLAVSSRVGVPLSGGLDSSLVTSLVTRQGVNLSAFSIGTELSAEFEFAETVSDFLSVPHKKFLIGQEEILEGMIRAIYHNEIFDGLSTEIQSPLFALYRKLEGTVDTLITGYGADLLFGGVVPPQHPTRAVNLNLWEQVYRTRWTGEFSPSGAAHYGIRVLHPFWNNNLIGFCLDLAPERKVSTVEVKVALRQFASTNKLLPDQIIWRRKLGIHEGSSVNAIVSEMIGANSYSSKTRFTYFAYMRMLETAQEPGLDTASELLAEFLHTRKGVTKWATQETT